jgi:hypothetical protein
MRASFCNFQKNAQSKESGEDSPNLVTLSAFLFWRRQSTFFPPKSERVVIDDHCSTFRCIKVVSWDARLLF